MHIYYLKVTLVLFYLFLPVQSIIAQEFSIVSGIVIDSETEIGLSNANIIFPDLDMGTSTDDSGRFILEKLPIGSHRFEVSIIGYKRNISTVDLLKDENNLIIKLDVEPLIMDKVEVQSLITSRLSTEKVEIISGDQIAKQEIQSLSELLESVPGVDVQTAYSLGRNVNVSIRGSSDYKPGGYNNRVLLLLDGFPILIPNSGAADWNAIPINNIQRVEVLHGPASALYGQNSMGGVINLITKNSKSRDKPSFGLSLGNYGAKSFNASSGFSVGSFKAFGDISTISSDGHRFNSDSELFRLSGKLEQNKGDGKLLTLSTIFTESMTGHPGFVTPDRPSLVSYRVSRRSSRYLQIHHRLKFKRKIAWSNSLAVHSFLTNYKDRKDTPADAIEGNSRYDDLSITGRSELFSMLSSNTLIIAGIEGSFDKSNVTVMNPIYGTPVQQTLASFLQARKSFGGGWSFVSGLRADYRRVDPGNNFSPRYFKALSPKLSINYRYSTKGILFLSINKGFRAPSLSELYLLHASSYGLFLQGTPSLNAESVWALEVGYKYDYSKNLFWKAQLFYNRYRDMIDFVYAVPVKALNWQSISSSGAELQLQTNLRKNVRLSFDYSFLYMENLTGDSPLLYRPKHKFNGILTFNKKKIFASISGRFVSKQLYENFLSHDYDLVDDKVIFPLKWMPSLFLVNANFSYKFHSIIFSTKIENIFDKEYQLIQDYPMQGRTWIFSISNKLNTKE